MRTLMSICVLVVTLMPGLARAQAAGDEAIARYLDDSTVAVARVDLAKIDAKALQDWLLKSVNDSGMDAKHAELSRKQGEASMEQGRKWLADFTAAGARRVYAVFSLQDLSQGRPPFL